TSCHGDSSIIAFTKGRTPPHSPLFPYTTLFRSSAIQGSNVPNPDEAVPSFVSGAMAKAGKGLLEGTLQAGTSAVPSRSPLPALRSEERFSRNAETDIVCRLLLEKKKRNDYIILV